MKTWFNTSRLRSASILATGLLLSSTVFAVAPDPDKSEGRNFDARISQNAGLKAAAVPMQRAAIDRLRAQTPDLAATFDNATGVTRTLYNQTGYLTEASADKATPLEIGLAYMGKNLSAFGLTQGDLANWEITDEVYSQVTGAHHIYLRQLYQGIPVYNAQLHFNINREGRLISINNAFVPSIASADKSARPALSAAEAVAAATLHLGEKAAHLPKALSVGDDAQVTSRVSGKGISLEPVIEAQLMWLPVGGNEVKLVWNFQIQTLDSNHYYDFTIDARSGETWTRFDWTNSGSYRVYEEPVESPIHTTPLPPSDARSLAVNPEDSTASPNGWFSGGTMDGNNVHACPDIVSNNVCDSNPQCSGTTCDFSINLSSAPSNSQGAAVANLFYWNNIIHDTQYKYGFDEAGGNFQENNFGNGGNGSDSVNADAQDGGGNCNANFSTPTDGGNPRMQMYTCNRATPSRDGDYDNGVIVHEYGHGISIRQVGGPGNSSCLNNNQQPGEGWSDWFGLVYTAKSSDTGPQARGIGAYLFNEPAAGGTIRDLPYSTSNSVNNHTYSSISGAAIPHGIGSRWAQGIWEVYWALVDKHGFSTDLLNPANGGWQGNERALLYVNEGLKNTACSPTFIAARDGIIQAVTDNFGGEDLCDVWQAFADFGLGTNASTGGSSSTTATNGFNIPASCDDPPPPSECPAGSIDFNSFALTSYSNQNASNNTSVANGGDTLTLSNNTWVRSTQSFNITANTVVEFTYSSTSQGEIHAIGFDADDTLNDEAAHFQFWGTQNWTGGGRIDYNPKYSGSGTQSFSIPVGQSYTGSRRLVFTNDQDSGSGANGSFSCVRVFESGGGGGGCTVDDDFEGGAAAWSNDAASTCSTGAYVVGNPTVQTNGGVTTQVGGSNSGTNSIFTATNTSAGADDVDGGNCILRSPNWSVSDASTLSVAHFHGQRDAGDDSSGDFFRLEYSTNGGSSWSTLASNGDSTSNAAWSTSTAQIPAGSNVAIRVQCSDGSGAGDLVECGIDDVSICDN